MKYIYHRNYNMNIFPQKLFDHYKITLSSTWLAMVTEKLGGEGVGIAAVLPSSKTVIKSNKPATT